LEGNTNTSTTYNQVTEKQSSPMIKDLGDMEITMHVHTKGMRMTSHDASQEVFVQLYSTSTPMPHLPFCSAPRWRIWCSFSKTSFSKDLSSFSKTVWNYI